MIEFEIDGKPLSAESGTMIIQAADAAGIYIPRFCYHKKLSIAASCRMCLVEVEKSPKTLPACATPVMPGMKVFTQSPKTIESQKSVMEFLLINHPLDCPICDQGGECELQDLSMGYGAGSSRYQQGKRSVKDKDLGPLIASEMTRCIHCTRCVRFGDEIAGVSQMGATGRGEVTEIGTYVQQTLSSELSGNIIDICPVGALTSKPYRFSARAWELQQHPAIAPHDCIGSNIFLHTRGEEWSNHRWVMRAVPRENDHLNESWISDRDRYSYEAIESQERLLTPLIKREGVWQETDWATALYEVMDRLQSTMRIHSPHHIGAFISPNATVEEGYLYQKLCRALECDNIDHRIRQADFSAQDQEPQWLGVPQSVADLETLRTVWLVGSDVRREQPIANHRLRKANRAGAVIMALNPEVYDTNLTLSVNCIRGSDALLRTAVGVLKALSGLSGQTLSSNWDAVLSDVVIEAEAEQIAARLHQGRNEPQSILLGAYALQHPHRSWLVALLSEIAHQVGATLGYLTEGANSAGLSLSGALPHRAVGGSTPNNRGLHAKQMWEQKLSAYLLFQIEPELDSLYPALALQALHQADHVIAFSSFRSSVLENYADVILPLATFAETSGTYVNVSGQWQTVSAAVLPYGQALPGWEILSRLGQQFGLEGFEYPHAETVLAEIKAGLSTGQNENLTVNPSNTCDWAQLACILQAPLTEIGRLGQWSMYRQDPLVRRATALQLMESQKSVVIRINQKLALQLGAASGETWIVRQLGQELSLPIMIDDCVADNAVAIPMGTEATAGFGAAVGAVELLKAKVT